MWHRVWVNHYVNLNQFEDIGMKPSPLFEKEEHIDNNPDRTWDIVGKRIKDDSEIIIQRCKSEKEAQEWLRDNLHGK